MIIVLFVISSLSLNDGAKIRLFSDTTKFRVAIRTDFQQPLIRNLVNKANSYFGGVGNIVFLTEKHSSPDKKIYLVRNFPILTVHPKSYSSYSSYSSDSSELTP